MKNRAKGIIVYGRMTLAQGALKQAALIYKWMA